MLESVVRIAIARRWLVLGLTLVAAGLGAVSFVGLPIDAVPDITNVQVQINAEAPGYSPLESEQRITFPIETALAPRPPKVVASLRSLIELPFRCAGPGTDTRRQRRRIGLHFANWLHGRRPPARRLRPGQPDADRTPLARRRPRQAGDAGRELGSARAAACSGGGLLQPLRDGAISVTTQTPEPRKIGKPRSCGVFR